MELGLAIGIFVIVAIILMALFCVVTRYFNYKLRKALAEQNEIYSLIQGIQGDREDINEGQYEDFVHKRIADKKKRQVQGSKTYKLMVEMTDMNEPLKQTDINIYGISKLKKRLQNEAVPTNPQSELRSLATMKPDKLSDLPDPYSQRSKGSQQNLPSVQNKKKPFSSVTIHRTIEKLASYNEDGIMVIEVKAKQLWIEVQNGEVKEYKTYKQTMVTPPELGFEDTLDAYGFQKGVYGAYKFTTVYEIVSMKPNQVYNTRSLKSTQVKQQIMFPSFYIYKDKFQNEGDLEKSKQKLIKK